MSRDFAAFVSNELVAPRHLWRALLEGPRSSTFVEALADAFAEAPGGSAAWEAAARRARGRSRPAAGVAASRRTRGLHGPGGRLRGGRARRARAPSARARGAARARAAAHPPSSSRTRRRSSPWVVCSGASWASRRCRSTERAPSTGGTDARAPAASGQIKFENRHYNERAIGGGNGALGRPSSSAARRPRAPVTCGSSAYEATSSTAVPSHFGSRDPLLVGRSRSRPRRPRRAGAADEEAALLRRQGIAVTRGSAASHSPRRCAREFEGDGLSRFIYMFFRTSRGVARATQKPS